SGGRGSRRGRRRRAFARRAASVARDPAGNQSLGAASDRGDAVAASAPGPVAVLDSSVLVPLWSRLVLQRLAAPPRPRYEPVWSEWVIAEVWRVLTWRWLIDRGPADEAALARAANRMMRRLPHRDAPGLA